MTNRPDRLRGRPAGRPVGYAALCAVDWRDAVSCSGFHAVGVMGTGGRSIPARRASGRAALDLVAYRHAGWLLGWPCRRTPGAPGNGRRSGHWHGDAYYLADPPEAERTYGHDEAVSFFRDMAAGRLPSTVIEGGDGTDRAQFICGFLGSDLRPFNPVLSALPRLLRVQAAKSTGGGLPISSRSRCRSCANTAWAAKW